MGILIVLGILSLFFGIMFLFFPNQLVRLSDTANKVMINFEGNLIKMRFGFGICLTAIGLVCFFLVYYFKKMGL